MKTLSELEELEAMRTATGLVGQALLDYYEANREQGQQFVKPHEMKRSAASFCMEIDKYIAEMRFFRLTGYQDYRPCLATLRDIKRIEKIHDDCETVVANLMVQMQTQMEALNA